MRSSLRIGGSSSTTRILTGAALMRRPPLVQPLAAMGRVMVNTAPGRSVRFAAADRAVQGLDEAARDGQAQPGARAHLVALLHAVELVEDALEVAGGNAVAFVQDLQPDAVAVAPALNADGRIRRRILGGVVEEIEQHLLEQHGIHHHHRQVGADLDLHAMLGQDLAGALQRGADDLADVVGRERWGRRRPTRAWSCRAGWR